MTSKTPRRIPKANIITGPKPIINQADKVWLGNGSGVEGTTSTPVGSGINSTGINTASSAPDQAKASAVSTKEVEAAVLPDTVDMTDIEDISYEQYYDATSKLVRYRAILKIRNSSTNKLNVEGVDARIYNPGA
jgi:hypothetical protein